MREREKSLISWRRVPVLTVWLNTYIDIYYTHLSVSVSMQCFIGQMTPIWNQEKIQSFLSFSSLHLLSISYKVFKTSIIIIIWILSKVQLWIPLPGFWFFLINLVFFFQLLHKILVSLLCYYSTVCCGFWVDGETGSRQGIKVVFCSEELILSWVASSPRRSLWRDSIITIININKGRNHQRSVLQGSIPRG